jgi:hypothetical protein
MFKLQIVTPEGDLVRFPGGGALEREFVEMCVKAILAKGVGLFRTENHVEIDVREAITETIYSLKADTRYAVK